jgi:hypothetical protein
VVEKLYREKLHGPYSSPDIIQINRSRRMRWAGHVAGMGERRGAYRFLVIEPDVKRTLQRPRDRWEGNIKMDFQEVRCGGMDGSSWLRIETGAGFL